jgi:hypothetical protein
MMYIAPMRQMQVRVRMCRAKMPTATAEDSVMPTMVRSANRASSATVADWTGSPGITFCA